MISKSRGADALALMVVALSLGVSSLPVVAAPSGRLSSRIEKRGAATPAPEEFISGNLIALAKEGSSGGKEAMKCAPKLSDEQVEALSELKDQFRVDTAEKGAQLMALRNKMARLLAQSKIDRKQVLTLQESANNLESELSQLRMKLVLDSAELLTPEQRQKLGRRFLMHSLMHPGPEPGPFGLMPPPPPFMMPGMPFFSGFGPGFGPPPGPPLPPPPPGPGGRHHHHHDD